MIAAGIIMILIIGVAVKVFDEQIRAMKFGKQVVVYCFFLSIALIIAGLIRMLIT